MLLLQEESSVEAQESISSPPVTTHIENTTPILKYALPPWVAFFLPLALALTRIQHDQQPVSVNLASLGSESVKDVRSPAERVSCDKMSQRLLFMRSHVHQKLEFEPKPFPSSSYNPIERVSF